VFPAVSCPSIDDVKIDPADPATFNTKVLTDNPNPRASSDEIRKITTMLKFMMAAYYDNNPLLEWTCYPCVRSPKGTTVLKTFKNDERGVYGYIAYNEELHSLVLAFRGTVTREGWIQDFKLWKDHLKGEFKDGNDDMKVHHGFFQAYESVKDEIIPEMDEFAKKFPGCSIHIVGFSLGGALADLYAAALWSRFPDKAIHLTTYGQPRVGNKEYAKYMANRPNLETMRLVHYRDYVPNSFPLLFGYRHHGTEFYVTTKWGKEMVKCEPDDHKCSTGTFPKLDLFLHLHCPGYSY